MDNIILINILGGIASFLTILCMYMAGNKNKTMWYVAILAQCIWFYIGLVTHQYYMIAAVIIKQGLNIRGLKMWENEK